MRIRRIAGLALLGMAASTVAGCGPRLIIGTGTTIGLKATPGDPNGGRSPQVTLGYKRAEAAIVTTKGNGATYDPTTKQGEDAYSTFASVAFSTQWFGDTELTTFISSGFAARGLTAPDTDAAAEAMATVTPMPAAPTEKPEVAPKAATPPKAGKAAKAPEAAKAHAKTGGNTFFDALQRKAKEVGGDPPPVGGAHE